MYWKFFSDTFNQHLSNAVDQLLALENISLSWAQIIIPLAEAALHEIKLDYNKTDVIHIGQWVILLKKYNLQKKVFWMLHLSNSKKLFKVQIKVEMMKSWVRTTFSNSSKLVESTYVLSIKTCVFELFIQNNLTFVRLLIFWDGKLIMRYC